MIGRARARARGRARGQEAATPGQLLLHVAQEVALSALTFLSNSWEEMASALLRALSRCHQAGQFTLMQEISKLLLPKGCDELGRNLGPDDTQSLAACDSVRAFLTYIRMYELWWSPSEVKMEMSSEEHDPGEKDTPEPLCDLGVLLSDMHAGFQNAQREIADVQQGLREMIQQHQRNRQIPDNSLELDQESDATTTPPSPEMGPESQSSNPNPVSLTELMKKLSTANHKLAEFPEYLKVLPFPDVLESCLVILHLPSSKLTSDLHGQALSLLQRHGSPDHQKATSKFASSLQGPQPRD